MSDMKRLALAAMLAALILPTQASAYIGPGMGAGAIAVVLGVLGSIFMAVVAVVYYPIKRMLKTRRPKSGVEQAQN
jgi:hypothetical protein